MVDCSSTSCKVFEVIGLSSLLQDSASSVRLRAVDTSLCFCFVLGIIISIMKRCAKCCETKSLESFPPSTKYKDGRFSWCRDCKNRDSRERYHANRDYEIKRVRSYRKKNPKYNAKYAAKWQAQKIQEVRRQVFAHFGDECVECGSKENLTLDHVNNDGGKHRAELRARGLSAAGGGWHFYKYLVDNQFDTDGYELQTLCNSCNISKANRYRFAK